MQVTVLNAGGVKLQPWHQCIRRSIECHSIPIEASVSILRCCVFCGCLTLRILATGFVHSAAYLANVLMCWTSPVKPLAFRSLMYSSLKVSYRFWKPAEAWPVIHDIGCIRTNAAKSAEFELVLSVLPSLHLPRATAIAFTAWLIACIPPAWRIDLGDSPSLMDVHSWSSIAADVLSAGRDASVT